LSAPVGYSPNNPGRGAVPGQTASIGCLSVGGAVSWLDLPESRWLQVSAMLLS